MRCIVDGGECDLGVESTVLDLEFHGAPTILRPGSVTVEDLQPILHNLQVYRPLGHNQDPQAAKDISFSSSSSSSSSRNGDLSDLSEESQRKMEIEQRPATPGLKYRHYSPNATVVLVEFPDPQRKDEVETIAREFCRRLDVSLSEGKRVGVIHTNPLLAQEFERMDLKIGSFSSKTLLSRSETIDQTWMKKAATKDKQEIKTAETKTETKTETMEGKDENEDVIKVYKIENDVPSFARHLFGLLRLLDQHLNVDVIFIEAVSEAGVGLAVMNRARKAASETISFS